MNSKQFDKDYRSISVIDNLIMELSLIKSGNEPSTERLEQGIELIDYLIERVDESRQDQSAEGSGICPLHPETSTYYSTYQINVTKEDLKGVKQFIQESIKSFNSIDKGEIESYQNQLLKLSIPIWKNQVSVLTKSHFKQIER